MWSSTRSNPSLKTPSLPCRVDAAPRIDRVDTGVSERVHIPRDDGKSMGGRSAREHGVRKMVV